MATKVQCSLPDHRHPTDCLGALEAIQDPSDVMPNGLESAVPCLFARLKHRIIRLRRRTHDDWPHFRNEVEGNLEQLVTFLSTRWLVSVADTYADFGTAVERRNAMCVALLANWEKLALTQRLIAGSRDRSSAEPGLIAADEPLPLWDGMTSMLMTDRANVLPNLFERLGGLMAETPVLRRILATVIQRMKAHPESTLASLERHHARDLFDDIEQSLSSANSKAQPAMPSEHVEHDPSSAVLQRAMIEGLKGIAAGMSDLFESQRREHRELQGQIGQLTSAITQLARDMNGFVTGRFAHEAWINETRYRDLLDILARVSPLAPPINVRVEAERPVAEQSPDHRFPHGTAKDNTRAPWFVQKCEELLGSNLSVLDLGCSGGGLVLDFSLRGHKAVGLEGSDYSLKRKRAEWRTLVDRLFTCDVTGKFEVIDGEVGDRMRFDLVTAWDVVEHLPEEGLAQFFDNVRNHLKQDGLFVGTISTRPSQQCPDGSSYHATVKPKAWWVEMYRKNGFELTERGPFAHEDFPRGNGISPLYPADFASEPDTGFHFAAKKLPKTARRSEPELTVPGPERLVQQAQRAHAAGEAKQAQALLRKALAQDPSHLEALNDLGVVLGEAGDVLEALKCLRRALELEPGASHVRENCARMMQVAGYMNASHAMSATFDREMQPTEGCAAPAIEAATAEPPRTTDFGSVIREGNADPPLALPGAPVILLSLPKAGTYLASELLGRLGLNQTYWHLRLDSMDDYSLAGSMEERRSNPTRFRIETDLGAAVSALSATSFAVGHLPRTEATVTVLEGCHKLLLVRELREALVSRMRFEYRYHRGLYDPSWGDETDPRARMAAFLRRNGEALIADAGHVSNWRRECDVLLVRFESFFGSEAGPAVVNIARHLGLNVPEDPQALVRDVLTSDTLTKSGARTRLDEFWSDEAERIFKAGGGCEINAELGYPETWPVSFEGARAVSD